MARSIKPTPDYTRRGCRLGGRRAAQIPNGRPPVAPEAPDIRHFEPTDD